MKAVTIKSPDKLVYQTVSTPQTKNGEMLIQVKAVGVNRLDLWMTKGETNISLPHIPGEDISGIISEIKGASDLKVGQEVIINPAIPCNTCSRCRRGLPCGDVSIFGYKTQGGFAEYVTVPIEQVYPKPSNLSFIEAASFPLTFLTAWHMLVGRAKIQKGERVFIWGASGGLGSAGVQIAKYLGAKVIAAASSHEDAKKIKKLGADYVVNYKKENVTKKIQQLTKGENIDVVFENVGQKTWDISVSLLAPYGRLVTAGATTGVDVKLNIQNLYRNQFTFLGALMGTPEEFEQVYELVRKGKLKPTVDKTFPLAQATDALKIMEESSQVGKIVLTVVD